VQREVYGLSAVDPTRGRKIEMKPRPGGRGFVCEESARWLQAVTQPASLAVLVSSMGGNSAPKGSVMRRFLYFGRPVPAGMR